MQLVLQYVRMSFCPENIRNWFSSPQSDLEFLQDLARAVSPFSRGPVGGNHRQPFFDPTGLLTIPDRIVFFFDPIGEIVIVFDPVGYKMCWRLFPATGPQGKLETAMDRSWRKLQVILMRGRPISNIFGAKAHASVLGGTLSTDSKSNCVRIGLKRIQA